MALTITPDVTSLTSDANPLLSGNVQLASGTNIALTQVGQVITVATTGVAPSTASYVTINSEASLSQERRLAVNATNLTLTDGGANSAVTINTIQDISTTSIPTFQRLLISGSTNQNFINASGTLDNATGNEIAYTLAYTTNKATSGNDTGLLISMTDTASPGISLPLDIQVGGTSQMSVDNAGRLSTKFLSVASTQLVTNTNTSQTTFGSTASGAGVEIYDIEFNLARAVSFVSGADIAFQRAVKFESPTYSFTSIQNMTSAATLYIDGPPVAGNQINLTNSYGVYVGSKAVTSGVQYGVGGYFAAPTGAFGSNIALIADGKLGVGTTTPQSQFDVQGSSFDTSMNHLCIDGNTRYSFGFFGGTSFTSIPAGGARGMLYDYGFSPSSNTTLATGTFQSLFTFGGTGNNTGTMVNGVFNTTLNGSGTVTAINSSNAAIITSAGTTNTITTARAYLGSNNFSGTGTVTDYVGYDQTYTYGNVAGTTTNTYGLRIGNPSKGAAYTLTNFYGVDIEDNTATFSGLKIGFYQKGTNLENRFVSNTNSFGQDATAGATIDVGGKLFIAGASGKVTKYNNLTTAGIGTVPVYNESISATKTANFTVFTQTPPATAGRYRVNGVITTTSATNTGTVQFTIDYKDSQGTTHTADIIPLMDAAGSIATTKTGASKEFSMVSKNFSIDATATNIVLKVVITGTVSYTVAASLEQVG